MALAFSSIPNKLVNGGGGTHGVRNLGYGRGKGLQKKRGVYSRSDWEKSINGKMEVGLGERGVIKIR